MGGSERGRAAVAVAIDELKAGAGEVGGNNRGPFVRRYLNGLAPEGEDGPWCAGFLSFCFAQNPAGMPFGYTVGARNILREFKDNGWTQPPNSGYSPKPGDVVCGGASRCPRARATLAWLINCATGFSTPSRVTRARVCRGFRMCTAAWINYWDSAQCGTQFE